MSGGHCAQTDEWYEWVVTALALSAALLLGVVSSRCLSARVECLHRQLAAAAVVVSGPLAGGFSFYGNYYSPVVTGGGTPSDPGVAAELTLGDVVGDRLWFLYFLCAAFSFTRFVSIATLAVLPPAFTCDNVAHDGMWQDVVTFPAAAGFMCAAVMLLSAFRRVAAEADDPNARKQNDSQLRHGSTDDEEDFLFRGSLARNSTRASQVSAAPKDTCGAWLFRWFACCGTGGSASRVRWRAFWAANSEYCLAALVVVVLLAAVLVEFSTALFLSGPTIFAGPYASGVVAFVLAAAAAVIFVYAPRRLSADPAMPVAVVRAIRASCLALCASLTARGALVIPPLQDMLQGSLGSLVMPAVGIIDCFAFLVAFYALSQAA